MQWTREQLASVDSAKGLSLGINFAITPRTLLIEKIVQEVEPALSKLPIAGTEHEYR